MNKHLALKCTVACLFVALIAALGFLGRALWQNFMWQMAVSELAGSKGALRASRDFQTGRLRVFVLAGKRTYDQYAGTNDGPFQVWYSQFQPDYYPFRYATEQMVEVYNGRMRYLHLHPDKFIAATNIEAHFNKP
jgi:hypothetical protein